MADVGKLALILSANSTGLSTDLDKATKRVKKFSEEAIGGFSAFAQAAALPMVGIGIAVEGIKKAFDVIPGGDQVSKIFGVGSSAAIESQIDKIKELHHESEKLGVSVESWQLLTAGARGAGIEAANVAVAVRKLGVELGAAARDPASEAGKAFKMFGLDAKQLAAGPLDEAFRKVLELGRGMDKLSAMFMLKTLAGKGGAEMLPLIYEDFGEVKNKLARTGKGITEHDVAITMELIKATKELDANYEGMSKNILIRTAPAKTAFYKGLGRIIEGDVSPGEFGKAAGEQVSRFMDYFNPIYTRTGWHQKMFGDIGHTVGGDFGPMAKGKGTAKIDLEEIKRQQDHEAELEKLYKEAAAAEEAAFHQKIAQFDALSAAQDRYINTTGKSIEQIAEYDAQILGLEGNALQFHRERAAEQQHVFEQQTIFQRALSLGTGLVGQGPTALPTAAEFGSEAALNAIAMQAQGPRGEDDLREIARVAVEEATKAEGRHQELVDAIKQKVGIKVAVLGP